MGQGAPARTLLCTLLLGIVWHPCHSFVPGAPARLACRGPFWKSRAFSVHTDSEPHFDEYGLPIEYVPKQDAESTDFKERFYQTLDAVTDAVGTVSDTARNVLESAVDPGAERYGVPSSERRTRLIIDTTPQKIDRRRAVNKALAAKDNVLRTFGAIADLPNLPVKAWTKYVAEPIQASRERERRKKAKRRAALEAALTRYYEAKNVFYDTLDTIADTTRASVKACKTVSRAVADAPARVTKTYNEAKALADNVAQSVQRGTDTAAEVATKMSELPNQVERAVTQVSSAWASVRGVATKITLKGSSSPPITPPKAKDASTLLKAVDTEKPAVVETRAEEAASKPEAEAAPPVAAGVDKPARDEEKNEEAEKPLEAAVAAVAAAEPKEERMEKKAQEEVMQG